MEAEPPPVEITRRVVSVILHRDGRVLLQHRDDNPNIRHAGMSCIFGGHIEGLEEPDAAARREIEEELGLQLHDSLQLLEHRVIGDTEGYLYAAPLPLPPESLTLMEGQGMALISPKEFDSFLSCLFID